MKISSPAWIILASLLVLLLVALLLASPPEAHGNGCATPRVVYHQPSYTPTYAPQVVVRKEVVVEQPVVQFTKFVPVIPVALVELAVLPTYSAAYVPPVQAVPGIPQPAPVQQAPALAAPSDMAKVMGILERINARLDRLEKGAPPVAQAQAPPPQQEKGPQPKEEAPASALAVVQNKCASCHDAKTAQDKGGNLVLISDGKLVELSARQANKVVGRSYAGTMPPKDSGVAPLTDAEVSVIVSALAK